MTEAELKKLCALWQKRLRLQDWNVRLVVKTAEDIEENFANIRAELSQKSAVLFVRADDDTSSLDTQMSGARDIEEDIAHELLHLHCEPFVPENQESPEYEAIEQAVGVLANCIVRLGRED